MPFDTILSRDKLDDTKRLYSEYMDAVRRNKDKKATSERARKDAEAEQHKQEQAQHSAEAAKNFHDGDRVVHERFGPGVVQDGNVVFSEEWFPGLIASPVPLTESAGELEKVK